MADINQLLNDAAGEFGFSLPPPPPVEVKKAEVAAAAAQKRVELGEQPNMFQMAAGANSNAGMASASDLEKDLRTMDSSQLFMKYGSAAGEMIKQQAAASNSVMMDRSQIRSDGEAFGDTLTGVASGFVGGLGGIAALGAGLVNDNAGVVASEGVKSATDFLTTNQSGAVRASRLLQQARSGNTSRDNQQTEAEELASGDSKLIAGLRRFGRDFVDTLGNSTDSTFMAQGTADAVGSLLGGGPVAAGLRKLGAATAGKVVTNTTARKVASGAAWPAATGLLEGGGAYTGSVEQVMGMSFEDLAANSEDFRALTASGMSPEDARMRVASEAGKTAAAIQAPVGMVTGYLTRALETPFRVPSVGSAIKQAGVMEPTEEAIQSSSGQLAQNIGVQNSANVNQSLSQGVGEAGAQGALFGFSAAGAVQTPGALVEGTKTIGRTAYAGVRAAGQAALKAGKPLGRFLLDRYERFEAQNEKASPVNEEVVSSAAADLNANSETAAATLREAVNAAAFEQNDKDAANRYIDSLVQVMKFDPEEAAGAGANIEAVLQGVTNRADAISRMANLVNQTKDNQELLNNAATLYFLMQPVRELQMADPKAFDGLEKDSPATAALSQYRWAVDNAENTPAVKRALRNVEALIQQSKPTDLVKPVTEESLATPEGQKNVQAAVAIAAFTPDRGNLDANEQILTHAAAGRLNLTPNQLKTLSSSTNLLRARKKMEDAIAASGMRRVRDVVSSQIVAGTDPMKGEAKSAAQHTREVLRFANSGNTEAAAASLEDFGKFVQHMKNKVSAVNQHFANGSLPGEANRVKYQQLQPVGNREFKESRDGLWVEPTKGSSIDMAQGMALEAEIVADVYNGLVSIFPELGLSAIQAAALNPSLVGNAETLAAEFRDAKRKQGLSTVPTKVEEKSDARIDTPTPSVGVATGPETVVVPAVETKTNEQSRTETDTKAGPERGADTGTTAPADEPAVSDAAPASESAAAVTTPLQELYGANNFARSSFSYPAEPRTRLYAEDSPIASVRKALSSESRFTAFLSGSTKRNVLTPETAKAYQRLLSDVLAPVVFAVEQNLVAFLGSAYSKSDARKKGDLFLNDGEIKTSKGEIRKGSEMNRWPNGKVLNLTQLDADGNLSYQPQMLEQASLATMQWLMSANSFTSAMDEADVADMTGVSETVLMQSPGLVQELKEGMSLAQAKRSLSQKIRNYWGLTTNSNADLAYAEGIPDSMAAEFLRALDQEGLIELKKITLTPAEHGVETQKDFIRVVAVKQDDSDVLATFQDAIEVASVIEPEHTNYIGEEVPSVAQKQMNNNDVNNTPAQKDALAKEQGTPFYVNPTMVGVYAALGRDNLLALFGQTIDDTGVMNDTHLMSVEGRNTSITAAYDHLFSVLADVQNAAAEADAELSDLPIRYAYNMSRVGRMQMLGKYSPQSSKLIREAILPTRTTLDLSNENSDEFGAYALGLAQALGIKVHNQDQATSVKQVMAMLNGPLDPAVELMREWLSTADLDNPTQQSAELGADAVATIKQAYSAAGADLSIVGLHALVDYAKLRSTDDATAFQTSIYLEADGVTNGPINAMQLMSTGEFSSSWVKNIGKGGLKFGAPQTMADVRRTDSKDLYQASTDAARTRLADLRNSLPAAGVEQMGHLLSLMSLFNSDVLYNSDMLWEDGALELKRGIAKNPLTITLYGSGEAGIAGKLTGALIGEVYARMSTLLQAMKADPNVSVADAMFPGDANADRKMEQFQQAMDALTQNRAVMSSKGFFLKKVQQPTRKFNPKTFKLTPAELQVMESNMLELFVKPMRQGINDTVGEPLMRSVAVLRDASQVQSIFLQNMYIQKVDELLNQKEKNDPNWRRGDFLSRNELNSIAKSLSAIFPLVQTGDQTFMINSQQSMELEGRDLQYGRSLDDKLRTDPAIYAPGPAGVRAIPMLTIGMGDGMMMQTLAQEGLQGTLKIFDGMNMPLNKIREYSERANAAVYESWKGNPHAEMLKTFDKFLGAVSASDITPDMAKELARALRLEDAAPDELMAAMQGLRNSLAWSAKSIDARHAAIDSLPVSVDQMAAAAQPFTNGVPATEVMSDEAAVIALNAAYAKEMVKAKVEQPSVVAPVIAEAIEPAIEKFGRVAASGVRILSPTALEKLAKTDAMTEAQKLIFGEIRRSGAADGFTVVAGAVEQLDAYIAEKGLAARPAQDAYGWINMGDSTIYLVNPSTETLVHELVHASSYATTLAYYQGKDLGANSKELGIAFKNLEAMKDEFLSMTEPAAESARTAILSANLESDPAIQQAKALNEFMAWALTNEKITKDLKTKPVPAFVKMVQAVIDAIKKVIWGKKIAPKAADDFLSNLQFNAGVVIRSQPSVGAVSRDGELFHTGSADARLDKLRAAFTSKIADLIKNDRPTAGMPLQKNAVSIAQAQAVSVALSFNAHGFPMTHKENITFRQIVAALSTEAEIDTNAMDRAQELYAHVTKTLKVEDFMADPESLEPDVRYYAQEKYSTIMGQYLTTKDAQGRSSLLPAFLALATVNDEFRAVLSKMSLPKSMTNKAGTLDAYLENTGTQLMDSLSRRLSGDTKSTNVQSSIDNLLEHVRQIAQDDQTALDQYASKAGGIVDRANELVMQGLEAASSALLEKGNALEKSATNKGTKAVAQVAKIVAAIVSEKNGATVSQGIMTATNSTKMWEPLRTFIGDLVGRTESNASVYDMIKAVRSMVQQTRQQFRDGVPQILNEKFKKKLTPEQWTAMYNTLAKTDLASLRGVFTQADIASFLSDQAARDKQIDLLEQQIQYSDKRHWPAFQRKMKQLANFMNTGEPGVNLLRNAEAISRLLGEVKAKNFSVPSEPDRQAIDHLITLYALDSMSPKQRDTVSLLVQSEADGVNFVVDYLVGQRKEEVRKATGGAKYNAYKGYVPSEQEQGLSMQVADDTEFTKLTQVGYVRVAPYKGSSVETGKPSKSYFFAPFSGRAVFNQGIMQNVRHTAGGVDASSGFTVGMTAGRITGKQAVARQVARMHQETNMVESLMPVYDKTGVLVAFERAVDPKITAKLQKSTDLAKMIGVWRGRQVEESTSQIYNEQLIDNLKKMYDQDTKMSSSNKAQYVNLFSAGTAKESPLVADAVSLFTNETMDYIRKRFGTEFWVRRDMVRDAVGERSASVGDLWNGVSNMSQENRDQLRKMLIGAMGRDAYKYVVKGEEIIQNFMSDMRTLIVVKSVIVPATNFVANIYQLVGRGVPMLSIAKGMPAKLGEIDSYGKSRLRQIEAEAELRAAEIDPVQKRKLTVEIQAITDAHRRMSIWPLIQAGEFSSISDVGMHAEDLELTSGRLHSYIEKAVDKLPGSVRTAGRYALITKDTALFRGLQKSVQYGDFIAKAVLYDDLTKRLKLTKAEALARITEEFVNYDRLPGRFRSYLENMGLLWFYNFKIRSTKVALSTIRNNPIHALMASVLPAPDFLGSVGSPISDNIAAKALGDSLGSSIGTDMAFRAPTLNPWLNLIH